MVGTLRFAHPTIAVHTLANRLSFVSLGQYVALRRSPWRRCFDRDPPASIGHSTPASIASGCSPIDYATGGVQWLHLTGVSKANGSRTAIARLAVPVISMPCRPKAIARAWSA